MKAEKRLNVAEHAIELLDRERTILMSGKISDLPELAEQKENLLKTLKTGKLGLNAPELNEIDKKSQQNAKLYESVMTAQKSVIERLTEISKAQKTLGTYEIDGTFSNKTASSGQLEKRT